MSGPGQARRRAVAPSQAEVDTATQPAVGPAATTDVAPDEDRGVSTPTLDAADSSLLLPIDEEPALLPMDGSSGGSEADLLPMDGSDAKPGRGLLLPIPDDPRGWHADLDEGAGYDGEVVDINARRSGRDGVVDVGVDGDDTTLAAELRGSGAQQGRGSADLELQVHGDDADVTVGADGSYVNGTERVQAGLDTEVVTNEGTRVQVRAEGDASLGAPTPGGGGELRGSVTGPDGSVIGGNVGGSRRGERTEGQAGLTTGEEGISVEASGGAQGDTGDGRIAVTTPDAGVVATGEGGADHGRGQVRTTVDGDIYEVGGGHDSRDGSRTDAGARVDVDGVDTRVSGHGGTDASGAGQGGGSAVIRHGEGDDLDRIAVSGQGRGGADASGTGSVQVDVGGDGQRTNVRVDGSGSTDGGDGSVSLQHGEGGELVGGRVNARDDDTGVGGGAGVTVQTGGIRVDADGQHIDGDQSDQSGGEVTVRAPGDTPGEGDTWKARVSGELATSDTSESADVRMEAEGQVYDTRAQVTVDKDEIARQVTDIDIVFEQGGIDLGALREAGLSLKGSIEIGEDDTHWESSATFTITRGTRNELTVTVRGGETSERALAGETGVNRMGADADQTVAFGEANVVVGEGEGETRVRVIGGGSDGEFALAADVATSIGDVDVEVAGHLALEDDAWRGYVEAMVAWQNDHHTVALAGSVTVSPGDEGYDTLWKLHAEYGYTVREGQSFTVKVGVASSTGEPVAFTTEVAYQHDKWHASAQAIFDSGGDLVELGALVGYGDVDAGVIHRPGGGFGDIDAGIAEEIGGETVLVIGTTW